MKKLILISIIGMMLGSCDNSDIAGKPVIITKYNDGKDCLCKYHYNGLGLRMQSFNDSCNKYSIGDTIK